MSGQLDLLDPILNAQTSWQKKKFQNPKNKITIGTLFSGIGAIEHALKRLKRNSEVAKALDITPARVSQIEKKALMKIRNKIRLI